MVTCIEAGSCPPTTPVEVFHIYDVTYGTGMTTMIMALIIGTITVAIYLRNRNLPMLAILGIYEIGIFSTILTSSYISSQYNIAEYVIGLAVTSAVVMMVLRLIKE